MPELPDITVYLDALHQRIHRKKLNRMRINHPFLLKTVEPPAAIFEDKTVIALRRIGKRIAIGLTDDYWIVLHLMISGRLQWKPPRFALSRGYGLAAFDFEDGTLVFTEAGTKRRASLHLVQGEQGLKAHDPGGVEIFDISEKQFQTHLQNRCGNRPIKKVLTDPTLFSGIGNAYSDEILFHAKMSPFAISGKLNDNQVHQLFQACKNVLKDWTNKLRQQTGTRFPSKVTAFHPDMAVHGKFGASCTQCQATIQRIRYAEMKETNYCPGCQTEGRILADRVMSRLLKNNRPKHLNELPEYQYQLLEDE